MKDPAMAKVRITTGLEIQATAAGPILRLLLKQGATSVPSEWMLIPTSEVPALIAHLERALVSAQTGNLPPAGRA